MSKKTARIDSLSVEDLLPESFRIAEQLSIKSAKTLESFDGLTFILAPPPASKANQDKKESEMAPLYAEDLLPEAFRKNIRAQFKTLGWSNAALPCSLFVEGKVFYFLPMSSVKTTQSQIMRQAGLDIAKLVKIKNPSKVRLVTKYDGLVPLCEGLMSGLYDIGFMNKSKLGDKPGLHFSELHLVSEKPASKDDLLHLRAFWQAECLTRFLQDAPPNYLHSEKFAELAEHFFSKQKGARIKIYGRKELEKMNAGAFLSVAKGSPLDPKMIVIEVDGISKTKTKSGPACFIGKGLTFDSGGTSLKPGLGMGEMKYDMSGGAIVFGSAFYHTKKAPQNKAVFIIGAVENIIGGHATRPSDIVQAMNGKTIDIQNTDAEGRLVLADLFCYAEKTFEPSYMVDAATLTGACVVALGHAGSAVMGVDQKFVDHVLAVAKNWGEPLWQLPLWPELFKEIKGQTADLNNITKSNVNAGSMTAGCFLKEFVNDTPWAHLDIAGTAWSCSATGYPPSGGSAYGLRLMIGLCDSGDTRLG